MSVIMVNTPFLPGDGSARPSGKLASVTGNFSAFESYRLSMPQNQYRSYPMEHLGMMSIKSYAARHGIDIHTVNGMVLEHRSLDETFAEIQGLVRRYGPPVLIGFSIIAALPEVLHLAERCKVEWPEVAIAIGNTFASLNSEEALRRHGVLDFAVVGDGEVTFTQLAKALSDGNGVEAIPGLTRWALDGSISTRPPALIDVEHLPWADRDELPLVLRAGFAPATYSTRGCPYRCTFCGTGAVSAMLGNRSYRARTVESVVAEIEYLNRDFGVDFVVISDDLFVTKHPESRARAIDFAQALARKRLGVSFMLDARVDSIDEEVFGWLAKAGLKRVFVGIESGSNEQLAIYRKRYLRQGDEAAAPIRYLADLGVEVFPGVMTFHPAVRPDELRETVALLRAIGCEFVHTLYERVTAYAGTRLHTEYRAKGYLTSEWPMGEWEFVTEGAAEVYRQVFDYVTANQEVTFERAAEFLLRCVDQWEARLAGTGTGGALLPTAMATAASSEAMHSG